MTTGLIQLLHACTGSRKRMHEAGSLNARMESNAGMVDLIDAGWSCHIPLSNRVRHSWFLLQAPALQNLPCMQTSQCPCLKTGVWQMMQRLLLKSASKASKASRMPQL